MQEIVGIAQGAIEKRVFPGCVIGILKGNAKAIFPFGRYTYAADSPVVTQDSLYDVASLTKSIVTATLSLQCIDWAQLSLDDKLIRFLPEYRTPHREEVTIRHLLTYTLGSSLTLSKAGKTPEEIFEAVCSENTQPPGTVFHYSNTPAYLLGIIVERIVGESLDTAAQRIFEELTMRETTFHPQGAVPTEGSIQDIVHDESARVFSRANRTVGHAGLFSSAYDLTLFLEHRLKHPDERLFTNQLAGIGRSAALGWELNQPWMGSRHSEKTFGKTGFTGSCLVVDAEKEIGIVILSNSTYPHRPADRTGIDAFRKAVCDIVFAS